LGSKKLFPGKLLMQKQWSHYLLRISGSTIQKTIISADDRGYFRLQLDENIPGVEITVTHIGYETKHQSISINDAQENLVIKLDRKIFPAQTVLITASVHKKGESPATFSEISGKEIEKKYSVQDVPEFLSSIPSTTFYSEGGNGIGYNYLSIRGFDQRRISISINGVPQNDPEDHNVYWLIFQIFLLRLSLYKCNAVPVEFSAIRLLVVQLISSLQTSR